ncbi:hypothetical protein CONLIGDRAFT_120447 [Coniochaeta ligniaria NRRL 30616]|uniref:GIT Spa2 homology (SHD) domain-containing protein n=1 Tax=Coniochaeta ligniaria NRRL 30616 TaxID=1408157 RepID=A0A1J7J2B6_9PEZI|nr:hypothetical protein CONLIGDRAFT_120447 [Coniochaeta ligniaria NRRL 30616]
MNGRNAPLSPVSLGGSEWNYQPQNDSQGPYPNARGQLPISPPNSGGSAGMMDGGFPPQPRSNGGPSPPASIGRSSVASNIYARSESGRSQRDDANQEAILGEHYVSLKRFLSEKSRDGRPNAPPNKARDKLQRLTGVQFLELSTDVYDELKRREAVQRRPSNASSQGPPPYLMPENNFHPKRNQARQKLSSLGPPRFRDLATDVFCELERRYPRFQAGDIPRMGSPMSMSIRGPPSRSQTPVSGMNGFPPPRPGSRMRRPSEASSIRSGRGGPPVNGNYGVPASPSPANGEYGRPMPKQFQSNTIVPNKSTMLEEDDEVPISPLTPAPEANGFGLGPLSANQDSERSFDGFGGDRSAVPSENDQRLIDEYEAQVRDLREKLDNMEDAMKQKEDEMNRKLDDERDRASASNVQKKEWEDIRADLENRLAEVQNLNDSLRQELDRLRDDHAAEVRDLREELEDARQAAPINNMGARGGADTELQRENEDLRAALQEQQQVTDEVRREAQDFLREMKLLSQQGSTAWERHGEMEKTIEVLEAEVRDWRNRYARTKTQLRNMRASSLGLTIEQDAAQYVKERGFTEENGLVKDVHVTKFQISIDELLRRARVDDPHKVIDSMKAVVVSVRRITKDIDDSAPKSEDLAQQQARLKSKVSQTANNLITASKNFAAAAGISPVSLLDAAASHLVAAVVEMLRTVKIRATPAGELEDDDDGTITPVDSTGFFSPRSNSNNQSQVSSAISSAPRTQDSLPPPPPFQGLGGLGNRGSADSSTYSPISSPRESYASKRPISRGTNGFLGLNKGLPSNPAPLTNGNGYRQQQQANRTEDVKIYLEDQTAVLVQTIQNLVQLIRGDAGIDQIADEIGAIADVVGKVVAETETLGGGVGEELTQRLGACRERLLEAGDRGAYLAAEGKDPGSREWRMWTQTLPPIAFEIARETKEVVLRLGSGGGDDFS